MQYWHIAVDDQEEEAEILIDMLLDPRDWRSMGRIPRLFQTGYRIVPREYLRKTTIYTGCLRGRK